MESAASEESIYNENLPSKDIAYHNAAYELDPEMENDPERVLSGRLSESSGYDGSDLYDKKVSRITHLFTFQLFSFTIWFACINLIVHKRTSILS